MTSAPEALALHHRTAQAMWRRASKGAAAVEAAEGVADVYKK